MVDEVDAAIERLRADGVPVLREPVDLPWGERIGYVADPDDNPVAIASATTR
jgi:lactoylglutathione lyase